MNTSEDNTPTFESLVHNMQTIANKYRLTPRIGDHDSHVVQEFLESGSILDVLRPDIFIIANLFNPLPFLYEMNYTFNLGIAESHYANVASFVTPTTLQLSDTIDRKLTEFAFTHQLKPYDFVYRFYFDVNCPNPALKRMCRTYS